MCVDKFQSYLFFVRRFWESFKNHSNQNYLMMYQFQMINQNSDSFQSAMFLAKCKFQIRHKTQKFQQQIFPDYKPLTKKQRKEINRYVFRAFFQKYGIQLDSNEQGNMSERFLFLKFEDLDLLKKLEEELDQIQNVRREIVQLVPETKSQNWQPLHLFFVMCLIYQIQASLKSYHQNPEAYRLKLEKRKKNRKRKGAQKNQEVKLGVEDLQVRNFEQNNSLSVPFNVEKYSSQSGVIQSEDSLILSQSIIQSWQKENREQKPFNESYFCLFREFLQTPQKSTIHQSEKNQNILKGQMKDQ